MTAENRGSALRPMVAPGSFNEAAADDRGKPRPTATPLTSTPVLQ